MPKGRKKKKKDKGPNKSGLARSSEDEGGGTAPKAARQAARQLGGEAGRGAGTGETSRGTGCTPRMAQLAIRLDTLIDKARHAKHPNYDRNKPRTVGFSL